MNFYNKSIKVLLLFLISLHKQLVLSSAMRFYKAWYPSLLYKYYRLQNRTVITH